MSKAQQLSALTNALLADSSGNVTVTGSLNTSNTYGFKNRIINGAMMIDQRNAGASVTPTDGAYTVDRWQTAMSQASKFTVQQNAGSVTSPVGLSNYLGVTVGSSANVTVGSSDYFFLRQYVEGFNFADMAFGTANASSVNLSFKVYSSLTGTFGGVLKNGAANRSYPFSYTVSSANTWTSISVTIAGDTSGTWVGATNGVGAAVLFSIGAGATFLGTASSWAGSNLIAPTGSVNIIATNSAAFYITGVQLEKGSTATSFDFREYGEELRKCQRYCQIVNGTNNYRIVGQFYNTTAGKVMCPAYVPFRSAPTVVLETGLAGQAVGVGTTTFTGVATLTSGVDAVSFDLTGATVGRGVYQQLTYDGVLSMSAEL